MMVIIFIMCLAALWNSLLGSEVKHEGWIATFIILLFALGVFLFILAYRFTDVSKLEESRKRAFDEGKKEAFLELEKKNEAEKVDQHDESETIDKIAATVLSGMQGIRTENSFCNRVLTNLAREMGFVQGIFYIKDKKEDLFNPVGEYALTDRKPQPFKTGEGLPGQAAENRNLMVIYDVPEKYFVISSGLGSSHPSFLILLPVLSNTDTIAVLELASYKKPDEITKQVLNKISSELVTRLNKFVVA
jgi:putative methionine-R-sulfoxide reductase with GAF domain